MARVRPARFPLLVAFLGVVACGAVTVELPDEIGADFDLEATLDELGNCDTLSDTFVAVVRQAAADIDELSESTDGRVPAGELEEKVDVIVNGAYFEIAERLGCRTVSQRLETLDRLRRLDPDSAAGDDLVTEIIRQLEEQGT